MSLTDRPLLMELVNKTLMEFELRKADLPGVPSKNFVWFDYGNLKPAPTDRENKRRYEDFKWRLRYQHRDVTLFMATINKDDVKDLLRRDDDWIPIGQGLDAALKTSASRLAQKICENPSTFQYNNCNKKTSDNVLYSGYVTPGYKQNWAMYSEFFYNSSNVKFSVSFS